MWIDAGKARNRESGSLSGPGLRLGDKVAVAFTGAVSRLNGQARYHKYSRLLHDQRNGDALKLRGSSVIHLIHSL